MIRSLWAAWQHGDILIEKLSLIHQKEKKRKKEKSNTLKTTWKTQFPQCRTIKAHKEMHDDALCHCFNITVINYWTGWESLLLHRSPCESCFYLFFFFSLLIVWAQVVALSANTALRCQSDNEVKYVGVWEMRKRETDGWQLKESWHKRKRMKNKNNNWKRVKASENNSEKRGWSYILYL